MAGDQEQRTLEVIKLGIAFLQHITTLSGAAILIVLALMQRAEVARDAHQLATTVFLFLGAALISLPSVVLLNIETERAGHVQASAGRFTTWLAGAVFSAAGAPVRLVMTIAYTFGAIMSAIVFVAFLLRRYVIRDADRRRATSAHRRRGGEDKGAGGG